MNLKWRYAVSANLERNLAKFGLALHPEYSLKIKSTKRTTRKKLHSHLFDSAIAAIICIEALNELTMASKAR